MSQHNREQYNREQYNREQYNREQPVQDRLLSVDKAKNKNWANEAGADYAHVGASILNSDIGTGGGVIHELWNRWRCDP